MWREGGAGVPVGDDAPADRVRALPHCPQCLRDPRWSNSRVTVGGANDPVWATNRTQASTRFVHEQPPRSTHMRVRRVQSHLRHM